MLDLEPHMNRSPFSVHHDFQLSLAFRLFRSMGLRHLPVVDDGNQVVGIITRKDLIDIICTRKYLDLFANTMSCDVPLVPLPKLAAARQQLPILPLASPASPSWTAAFATRR